MKKTIPGDGWIKTVSEDSWLVESGTYGRGFTLASFPTKRQAEDCAKAIMTSPILAPLWEDLHVISVVEVLLIRTNAGYLNPRKPVGKYRN